jgi:iron(III) transport system substrate-binding protein
MIRRALLLSVLPMSAFADVNVYTTRQPELIQPVIDGFTESTGIAVNLAFVEEGPRRAASGRGRPLARRTS